MKAIIRGVQSLGNGVEVMFDVFNAQGVLIDTVYAPIYVVTDLIAGKTGGDITTIAITRFLSEASQRGWSILPDDIYCIGMNTISIKTADSLVKAAKI